MKEAPKDYDKGLFRLAHSNVLPGHYVIETFNQDYSQQHMLNVGIRDLEELKEHIEKVLKFETIMGRYVSKTS